MKVLITGIAGFYGHHLAKFIQDNYPKWGVVGIDRLDEGGSQDRLKEINYQGDFYYHDLRSPIPKLLSKKIGKVDIIFHLAAMSHVDRSIKDPIGAVYDNVLGTANILEYARKVKPKRFIYFSTDETYGPRKGNYKFKEWDRLRPGSPYSATKAAGEELSLCYHNTYGVPVIVTNCMNIFGERQHPEKFIPKAIGLILKNKTVPIYGDKSGKVSGSRSYIYADDVSRALITVLNSEPGEKFNIEGSREISNLRIAQTIAKVLGKKLSYKMVTNDKIRPGNDFSYGIDGSKLQELGFDLEESNLNKIKDVVKWYLDNPRWLMI